MRHKQCNLDFTNTLCVVHEKVVGKGSKIWNGLNSCLILSKAYILSVFQLGNLILELSSCVIMFNKIEQSRFMFSICIPKPLFMTL